MKQLLFKNFILLLLCLFASCSQDNISDTAPLASKVELSNISQLKISKVLSGKNKENQKIAYRLLSPEEKYSLWYNKYEKLSDGELLNSQGIILNDKQKKLIEELKNKITPKFFDINNNNDDDKSYFTSLYAPVFLKRAQKLFNYEQLRIVFYTLSEPASNITLKQLATSRVANSEESCDCNQGAIVTCQWGADRCEKSSCKDATATGCGFMWMWECNGTCGIF